MNWNYSPYRLNGVCTRNFSVLCILNIVSLLSLGMTSVRFCTFLFLMFVCCCCCCDSKCFRLLSWSVALHLLQLLYASLTFAVVSIELRKGGGERKKENAYTYSSGLLHSAHACTLKLHSFFKYSTWTYNAFRKRVEDVCVVVVVLETIETKSNIYVQWSHCWISPLVFFSSYIYLRNLCVRSYTRMCMAFLRSFFLLFILYLLITRSKWICFYLLDRRPLPSTVHWNQQYKSFNIFYGGE